MDSMIADRANRPVQIHSPAGATDLSRADKSARTGARAGTLSSLPSVILETPVVVVALITIAARGTDATLDLEIGLVQR